MKGVVLVGHGGVPTDCPREIVEELKRLEAKRRFRGRGPTAREVELDRRIREWPRTPDTDPYQAGLEALAERLRPLLNGTILVVAYNEFCAPSLEEAVKGLLAEGVREVLVISSMLTRGGVHSEREIPEAIEQLRTAYPKVSIRYLWPFDLDRIAHMLAQHLRQVK